MNMQILTRNEDLVKVSQRNESKEVTTTSLKVAEFFNKIADSQQQNRLVEVPPKIIKLPPPGKTI